MGFFLLLFSAVIVDQAVSDSALNSLRNERQRPYKPGTKANVKSNNLRPLRFAGALFTVERLCLSFELADAEARDVSFFRLRSQVQ
jgi:hypothetical protein